MKRTGSILARFASIAVPFCARPSPFRSSSSRPPATAEAPLPSLVVPASQHLHHTPTNSTAAGFSNIPENTVYSGPQPRDGPVKRVTQAVLRGKYNRGEKLTCVTAYDYPSAVHVDEAGIDMLLVGDSASMVIHGHDTTLPITVDELLVHCRAVARGARRPLLIGDLPFGSYESSPEQAIATAVRFMKEGGMDAIKLEGGTPARVSAAQAITGAGIAVMGHVGLVPQSISVLGGFRPQGQSGASAVQVIEQALALQDAGCFAIVLECVPAVVGAAVTKALKVPTIGIGAGPYTSGQVLVYHDLLGMMTHPHHAKVTPKFCKQYARVGDAVQVALGAFKEEVGGGVFPGRQFSPYKMGAEEVAALVRELRGGGRGEVAAAAEEVQQWVEEGAAAAAAASQKKP